MYFDLRLFGMTQGVRLRILLAAAIGLIAVGAGVAGLAIFGVVIARVFRGEAEFSSLAVPLAGVAVLIVARGLFQYLQNAYSHHTSSIVKIRIRKWLYDHCLALGPGHFDQRRTGGVILTLGDGVEALETFFGQYLPQFIVAAVAPILIFVFMAVLDIQI
ncbi:MAG: ABC transporter transmembrane domain-containing protein, partial [Dehalococcoidia bacterium]